MALLLAIDTAVSTASVCLARDGRVLSLKTNPDPRDSAAWVHVAIRELLVGQKLSVNALDAIALSAGPGSYTGLRVGMATAKGLCYAAGLPLITIGTLDMMAAAAGAGHGLLCPMIDARRMEVFAAVFDARLNPVLPPRAVVLEPAGFDTFLNQGPVCFFGNGSHKFRGLVQHPNAVFREVEAHAGHLIPLAMNKLRTNDFADLAYAEPFYGKAFFDPRK